jgi:hypothetical protein
MKGYSVLLWIFFLLAAISLLVGIIGKLAHLAVVGVAPIGYLRFAAVCLLFCMALSLAQMSLKK